MKKYRKKPVIIEAMQFFGVNYEEISTWSGGRAYIRGTRLPKEEQEMEIQTLEGDMRANFGDFIIKGVEGEFYPCKPSVFLLSYEEVI